MKITTTFCTLFLCILVNISSGQGKINTAFEANIEYGLANDSRSSNRYAFVHPFLSDFINLTNRSSTYHRNYSFSYSRFFSKEHGIKISVGKTAFGFDYEGVSELTDERASGTFTTEREEYGILYIHRSELTSKWFLLVEPGFSYHSSGGPPLMAYT